MTHGGMGYAREYHVKRYFSEIQILASRRSARNLSCRTSPSGC